MNSCRFIPNLLRSMCAKNYLNITSFGKDIEKTKGCSFLGHSVEIV